MLPLICVIADPISIVACVGLLEIDIGIVEIFSSTQPPWCLPTLGRFPPTSVADMFLSHLTGLSFHYSMSIQSDDVVLLEICLSIGGSFD